MNSTSALPTRLFLISTLCVILFSCFGLLIAALLQLGEKPADFDLIFSPPQSFSPGESPQIALYALEHNSSSPVKGLNLVVRLSSGNTCRLTSKIFETVEKKPGLYLATIELPQTLHEEIWHIEVFASKKAHHPTAIFPIKLERRLTFAAVPPQSHLNAGGTYEFALAAVDAVTMHPASRFPIRCEITTPDGLVTTNRTCFTNTEGTTIFPFSLRKQSPIGEYKFNFKNASKALVFKLPTMPAQPFSTFCRETCLNFVEKLPEPIKALMPSNARQTKNARIWRVQDSEQAPKITASIKNKNTIEASFNAQNCDTVVIEAWLDNRLLYSSICSNASNSVEISFKRSLPRNIPIELHLWQKKRLRILSDSAVIAPASFTNQAANTFKTLAEICASNSESILQGFFKASSPPKVTTFKNNLFQHEFNWALESIASSFAICLFWSMVIFICFAPIIKIIPLPDQKSWRCVFQCFTAVTGSQALAFMSVLKYPDIVTDGPTPIVCICILIAIEKITQQRASDYIIGTINKFVALLQIPAAIFILHQAADMFHLPQPTSDDTAVIVMLSIALTAFALYRLKSLSFALPHKNDILQSAHISISNSIDLLSSYGWKSALLITALLSLLSFMLFKSYIIIGHFENKLLTDKTQVSAKHAYMVSERIGSTTFISQEKLQPNECVETQSSAFKFFEPLSVSNCKFLLLTGKMNWSGKRIQRIKVFTEVRTFLDGLIEHLKNSDSLWSISLELGARAIRSRLLDKNSQTLENMEMESALIILGHILATSLQENRAFSDTARNFILNTLLLVDQCIFVDDTFKQILLNLPHAEKSALDESEFPFMGVQSDNSFISPNKFLESIFPALRPGGALILESCAGKRIVFPINQDTLTLTTGASFKEDFEITSLEAGRAMPLMLEVFLEP